MAFTQWAATEITTSFSVEKEGDAYGFHGLQRCCASWIPSRRTVNEEYYLGVMRRLRKAIRHKRPDLWANNSWILHHDSAPSHNAIVIREHLAKTETNTIQQPPNLSNLASCDFFLFGRLKKPLRGTRYSTRDDVMEKSKMALLNVLRIGSSAGISALQSMGSTLKGTISIMMNKLVFLILKIKS